MPMIVQLHEGVALKKFPLDDKTVFRIGRDPDSDIYIDDAVEGVIVSRYDVVSGVDDCLAVRSDDNVNFGMADNMENSPNFGSVC